VTARVIVVGGGITGLLTALAVSRWAGQVTLVERDSIPDTIQPRKGVPQGHHGHTLLSTGQAAMEALCPGIRRELLSAGAVPMDPTADLAFYQRLDTGFMGTLQTQPLLASILRRRVRLLPNVGILQRHAARNPIVTGDGTGANDRIAGVALVDLETGKPVYLPCDLLIDAGGRTSPLPRWMKQLGYPAAPEENLPYDLTYVSRRFHLAPDRSRRWQVLLAYPQAPFGRRTGFISPVEGGHHVVTLAGYFGDAPGTSPDEFLAFARSLPNQDLYRQVAAAVPVSPARRLRIPDAYLRRYDMAWMPRGLLAIGDSICCLNPGFGQGISVAACQALALRDFLDQAGGDAQAHLAPLQRRLVDIVLPPWMLTLSGGGIFAGIVSRSSKFLPALNWYAGTLLEPAARANPINQSMTELTRMLAAVHPMLQPHMATELAGSGLRRIDSALRAIGGGVRPTGTKADP